MPEHYNFNARDRALLTAATSLLRKVTNAAALRPAELVSVAKLQHVLSLLPRVTLDLNVTVQVTGPRRKFGEIETWHCWDVAVEGERLSISSGGHFYRPSTGGDAFTTMEWAAVPGEPAEFDDYRESLAIVPDVRSFPEGITTIDFASAAYKVEITDPDNPLLDDDEDLDEEVPAEEARSSVDGGQESEADAGAPQLWSVTPVEAAEKRLASTIDLAEVEAHEPQKAFGIENCDFCGCSLSSRGLFVDGCLRG